MVARIFGVDGVDGSGVPTLLLVRLLLHSLSPLSQRDLLQEEQVHIFLLRSVITSEI